MSNDNLRKLQELVMGLGETVEGAVADGLALALRTGSYQISVCIIDGDIELAHKWIDSMEEFHAAFAQAKEAFPGIERRVLASITELNEQGD